MRIHELLNVSLSLSGDEMKRAFRKGLMKVHPDRGGCADDFIELQEAWKEYQEGKQEKINIKKQGVFFRNSLFDVVGSL